MQFVYWDACCTGPAGPAGDQPEYLQQKVVVLTAQQTFSTGSNDTVKHRQHSKRTVWFLHLDCMLSVCRCQQLLQVLAMHQLQVPCCAQPSATTARAAAAQ